MVKWNIADKNQYAMFKVLLTWESRVGQDDPEIFFD